MPLHYPFTAVLGCDGDDLDDLGLALVLTAVSPEIGGVLVRGQKGTAKSTAVRALATVLPPIDVFEGDRFSVDPAESAATSPDGPFHDTATTTRPVRLVELPVGATEDRVLGSLQLERALSQGKVEYEPGLLARAHRGILYVDEVNLLHDHLVDLLLDAAATGQVSVERDGISVEHTARFVLIGTMNPEEGELRPQLLDRFGLTVEVAAPRDPALRVEVVRRRLAFDSDPAAFVARHHASERALTGRIGDARDRLPKVRLTEAALLKVAEVCAAFEVDGLRADIVTARTAVAHAAWEGRDEVNLADIRRAALLALPHRRRRNPFDAPGLDQELLDQVLGDDELPPDPPEGAPPGGGESETGSDSVTGSAADSQGDGAEESEEPDEAVAAHDADGVDGVDGVDGTDGPAPGPGRPGQAPVGAGPAYRPRLLSVAGLGDGEPGRRSRARSTTGRRVGARPGTDGTLDLVETLKAAAGGQATRGAAGGRVALREPDLRVALREGKESNLVLFCVDASGSMAARRRMVQVKTAVLSLLLDAYRRRDRVGLVTFRGTGAEVTLPPTRSVDVAAARLEELPAGGRTPLAEGLLEAARTIERERLRDPHRRPLLVVVTDGRATGGADPVARSQQAARHLASLGVATVVVDGESGPLRLGLAARLAELLGAEHLPVADVSAAVLTESVRHHTRSTNGAA